jgi:hypothetical protein
MFPSRGSDSGCGLGGKGWGGGRLVVAIQAKVAIVQGRLDGGVTAGDGRFEEWEREFVVGWRGRCGE